MSQPFRILIADDHPFFSDGVINALMPHKQYEVVGSVTNAADVITSIPQLQPQILILDINMPGQNGLELIGRLRSGWPQIKILVLSMYMPSDINLQPEKAGIDGYVLKNSGTETLLTALGEICDGGKYFDPNIQRQNNHSEDGFSRVLKLSSREKEILQMIKDGNNTNDIAVALFISVLTVKTHRKNIMAKMDVKNVAALIKKTSM